MSHRASPLSDNTGAKDQPLWAPMAQAPPPFGTLVCTFRRLLVGKVEMESADHLRGHDVAPERVEPASSPRHIPPFPTTTKPGCNQRDEGRRGWRNDGIIHTGRQLGHPGANGWIAIRTEATRQLTWPERPQAASSSPRPGRSRSGSSSPRSRTSGGRGSRWAIPWPGAGSPRSAQRQPWP